MQEKLVRDILFFDLDGTLVDSFAGIGRTAQLTLAQFGIQVEDINQLRHFAGPPPKGEFIRCYGFDEDKADEAVRIFRSIYKEIGISSCVTFPGIAEMLANVRASGKTMVVATTKPLPVSQEVLERLGLTAYFDCIEGSSLDGRITEKKEVIQEIFRVMGLTEADHQRIWMIGDRKYDVLGAKACGLETVGVRYGYAEPGELEQAGARYIVETVSDLEAFLIHGRCDK